MFTCSRVMLYRAHVLPIIQKRFGPTNVTTPTTRGALFNASERESLRLLSAQVRQTVQLHIHHVNKGGGLRREKHPNVCPRRASSRHERVALLSSGKLIRPNSEPRNKEHLLCIRSDPQRTLAVFPTRHIPRSAHHDLVKKEATLSSCPNGNVSIDGSVVRTHHAQVEVSLVKTCRLFTQALNTFRSPKRIAHGDSDTLAVVRNNDTQLCRDVNECQTLDIGPHRIQNHTDRTGSNEIEPLFFE